MQQITFFVSKYTKQLPTLPEHLARFAGHFAAGIKKPDNKRGGKKMEEKGTDGRRLE